MLLLLFFLKSTFLAVKIYQFVYTYNISNVRRKGLVKIIKYTIEKLPTNCKLVAKWLRIFQLYVIIQKIMIIDTFDYHYFCNSSICIGVN